VLERLPNLRHFAAVTGVLADVTVTRAARTINLTQTAIIQAIRVLEEFLGIQLFEHILRGMRPTEATQPLARRPDAAIAWIGRPRAIGWR
jgi:DNA-binding transcriptional LysR family regulator